MVDPLGHVSETKNGKQASPASRHAKAGKSWPPRVEILTTVFREQCNRDPRIQNSETKQYVGIQNRVLVALGIVYGDMRPGPNVLPAIAAWLN